jgi:hypothetical protein
MPTYRTELAHDLGRTEVVERLMAFSEKARTFSNFQGSWKGSTATFTVSVQGIAIRGALEVREDSVRVDYRLPLIAMPFVGWTNRLLKLALKQGLVFKNERAQLAHEVEARTPVKLEEADESDAPPVVLFLHIPKAGGMTLGEYVFGQCRAERDQDEGLFNAGVLFLPYGFLKERDFSVPDYVQPHLRRADLRAVIGHFWFGVHQYVTRPWRYVTILREPVERVVSLYRFLQLEGKMSLDEFVSSPPFAEVDNDQTRRVAGVDPPIGSCTAETLRVAQDNLRRHFAVVGTTERFDETLVLLRRRLGWTRDMLSYPRNVNPVRLDPGALSRGTVEAIRRRNAFDVELHRYATNLLEEAVAAEGPVFADELTRYRVLRDAALAAAPKAGARDD